MTMKPFEIQGQSLSIGGVELNSSSDGKVVIPGITRATGYRVEEVQDTGDQTRTFSPGVVAIDYVTYNGLLNQADVTMFADYEVNVEDNGEIDEIKVNGHGTYSSQESADNETNDMYVYVGSGNASDRPIVAQDWVTVPFRPSMRSTGVESEFGSGGGTNLPDDEQGYLQNDGDGNLSWSTTNADLGDMRLASWGYPGNNPLRITHATRGESVLVQTSDDPDSGNQGRTSIRWHIRNEPNGEEGSRYSQVDVQNDGVWIKNADWSGSGGSHYWHFDGNGNLTLPQNGNIVDSNGVSVLGGGTGISGLEANTYTEQSPGEGTYELAIATTTDNQNSVIAIQTYQPSEDQNNGPAVSIGRGIGGRHGDNVVAIGNDDVGYDSKKNGVYIGYQAGWNDSEALQGENAIAIGAFAARNIALDNSITLNATGAHLDPTVSGLFIKPIRPTEENIAYALYYNETSGEVTYTAPTGGGNDLAPELTKVDGKLVSTSNLEFQGELSGSIIDLDSGGNFDVWFNRAVSDSDGNKYVIGANDDGYDFIYAFSPSGTVLWKESFTQITGDGPTPFGLKFVNGNLYVAAQFYNNDTGNNHIAVYRLIATDGSVDYQWILTNSVNANYTPLDITVNSEGQPIVVGSVYGQNKTFTSVAAQAGSNLNNLVVNSSDLDDLFQSNPWASWYIQTDPNDPSSWYSVQDNNYLHNLPVTAVSGTGTGGTVAVRYLYNNGTWNYDYAYWETSGSGYNTGDVFKVLGSALGGVDGVDDIMLQNNAWWVGFVGQSTVPEVVYSKARFRMSQNIDFSALPGSTTLTKNSQYQASGGFFFDTADGIVGLAYDAWNDTTARDAFLAALGNGSTFTATFATGASPITITLTSDFAEQPPGFRTATYTASDTIDAAGNGGLPETIVYGGSGTAAWNIRVGLNEQAFIWTPDWQHSVGALNSENSNCVTVDGNDNIYMLVSSQVYINDVWNENVLVKLNSSGIVQWKKYISDSNGSDNGGSIIIDSSNYVIVIGRTNNGETIVTKLDSDGQVMWQSKQTNDSSWNNFPTGGMDADGNIIVMGSWEGQYDSDYVISVMKLSSLDGSLMWARKVGNTQGYDMYDYYDEYNQAGSVNGSAILYSCYTYDTNDSNYVGVLLNLNTDGTGTGTYGRWTYYEDTYASWSTGNSSNVFDATDLQILADDTLVISGDYSGSVAPDSVGNAALNVENISSGGGLEGVSSITFADGTTQTTAASGTKTWTNPNNNVWRIEEASGGNAVTTYGGNELWWDAADLPSGNSNFRGAIIEYHAYCGMGTIIGTIHLAQDYSLETATHTEHMSGSQDLQYVSLWEGENNYGQLYFRRTDGGYCDLMIQWTAKVFYGSEYNC